MLKNLSYLKKIGEEASSVYQKIKKNLIKRKKKRKCYLRIGLIANERKSS